MGRQFFFTLVKVKKTNRTRVEQKNKVNFIYKSVSLPIIKTSKKMAMSAGEIVMLVFLLIIVALVIWYFVVAYQYGQKLNNFSYTRGANLDTKDKNKGVVNLTCEQGSEICVWNATAICSGAKNSVSNTEGGPEPISNGADGNSAYGKFDINNTIDLTKDMLTKANGNQSYSYNFDVTNRNFGTKTCPMNYDVKNGSGQRPQLIATYSCIPKGTKCVSSVPVIPPKPPGPPPPPSNKFSRVGSEIGLNTISINNKNQICGTKGSESFLCSDNYKSQLQWKSVKSDLIQISLSDSGHLSGADIRGAAIYVGDFNNPSMTPIAGTGPFGLSGAGIPVSWTTNKQFKSTVQRVMGNNPTGTNPLWISSTIANSVTNQTFGYGWTNFDSNKNGDICGIKDNNLSCFDNNGIGRGNISTPFVPKFVSLNSKGLLCATTKTGDISCANMSSWTQTNPKWDIVSQGQDFGALSINDSGVICAIKNSDGTVWCNQ